VNVEPLPDALTTVTSPRNMRASLRVIASPRPGLPKRCAVETSAWVHLGHAASLRRHGPQKCMKIRRGCSVSMWLWIAVTSMPLDRKALITGFTSSAVSTKSPVMAALRAGRLEADAGRHAGRACRAELHSVLIDRIAARNPELINAAIVCPLAPMI
jgi:hypothetical protein